MTSPECPDISVTLTEFVSLPLVTLIDSKSDFG